MTDGTWPAQEPRRSPHGMIASVNPLASAAGLRILRKGGNAVDAAIAAGAVLTVVEPLSGQLGGDAFMLIAGSRQNTVTAINGSGAAPMASRLEQFVGGIPESGWLAATVPGMVDAWRVALDRHGTLPPATLFEEAIGYAEQGFPVTARLARNLREFMPKAKAHPATLAVFAPDGQPPDEGSVFRQPDLDRTLRSLAQGLDGFYRGPIAAAIVEASTRGGGLFSARDLAEHRTDVLQPISTTYRGWTVLEQPPVSQGVILLVALNILETSPIPDDPASRVHQQVEAHKLALDERLRRVGDPRVSQQDLHEIVSKARAHALAARIDVRRAAPLPLQAAGHPDTTYLCVVDADRTVVSYIHSLYASGGNGIVADGTGILLNNRVGGTPGSFWQVQTNLQLISNLVDHGMPLQAAVDAPRWTMGEPTSWADAALCLEGRFGEETAARLKARGHTVRLMGNWQAGGAAQLIQLDGSMLIGAGDPRPGTSSVIGY
ncbi:MAG: gamma-glutamyltransferase family protein [Chloroflexi bacterium]|nr:MAG: gamma-glutamyltransferase family protein [Chloroflexota bacterium]